MKKIKPMNLGYSIKLAFNGLIKNSVMTLSSIFVLLSCLLIMGSFWLVTKNINYNIEKIDNYNKLVVFIDKEATENEVIDIGKKLEKINGVETVEFKSKDVALEEQVNEYEQSEFLIDMYKDDNPLKDSYIITYESGTNVNTIKFNIEKDIEHISKINVNMEVVNQIESIKHAFVIIFTWLMILLLLVALFVIINTIKLSVYARRDEISLMRYIGATNSFISMPFLIEGLIIGLISAGIGFALQYLIYKYLMLELIGQYDIISIIPFAKIRLTVIIAFIVIGVITGFVGSLISLKKYNKENY